MAQLTQLSMTASDTSKLTISMWARVNSLAGATLYETAYRVPLIEFGEFSEDNSYLSSGLWLVISADLAFMTLEFAASGRPNSIDLKDCLSGNWQQNVGSAWTDEFDYVSLGVPHTEPAGVWNDRTTQGTSWFPRTSIGVADSFYLQIGRWIHIFATIDTSTQSEADEDSNTSGPNVELIVCGVNKGPFTPDDTAARLIPNFTALSDMEDLGGATDAFTVGSFASSLGGTSADFDDTGEGGGIPYDGGPINPDPGGIIKLVVPAFDIGINSFQIGVPGVFYSNSIVQLHDVQVWMGQTISTAQLSKFVTLLPGGAGRAVTNSISVASAAFGQQTYAFGGHKSRFIVNRGSGGSVSLTGTVNDISAPSF